MTTFTLLLHWQLALSVLTNGFQCYFTYLATLHKQKYEEAYHQHRQETSQHTATWFVQES